MSGLSVVCITNGQFVQNCYLLADGHDAVIVDPGLEPERFLAELATRDWNLRGIWITHAHVDHIFGVGLLKRITGAPIWMHPADRPLYDRVTEIARSFGIMAERLPEPDRILAHGDTVMVGRHRFEVRHTPGHSPGSVSFVGRGMILGGDVLHAGSIGGTDMPGADLGTLLATIETQFFTLPDGTLVRSGHGPETTIGAERKGNPALAVLRQQA